MGSTNNDKSCAHCGASEGTFHSNDCPKKSDGVATRFMGSDDRSIAQRAIETALDVVMKQRRDQHGDAENSFAMIAELWSTYVNHRTVLSKQSTVILTGADVAFMMDLLKTARATYGDGAFGDHYVDKIGYTSLAAMLQKAKV